MCYRKQRKSLNQKLDTITKVSSWYQSSNINRWMFINYYLSRNCCNCYVIRYKIIIIKLLYIVPICIIRCLNSMNLIYCYIKYINNLFTYRVKIVTFSLLDAYKNMTYLKRKKVIFFLSFIFSFLIFYTYIWNISWLLYALSIRYVINIYLMK